MIKINLLAAEHSLSKKTVALPKGRNLTILCSLILIVAPAFAGWRYFGLTGEAARIDSEIASTQEEATRLRAVIAQVEEFETRKASLEQRVALIEELRREQSGPVHMLEQISRALPSLLWLTRLQQGAEPGEVLVEGLCTTMTGLSDFVGNLEASGYFRRSVEIVSSQTEAIQTPPGELIRFSIRAIFEAPVALAATPVVAAGP